MLGFEFSKMKLQSHAFCLRYMYLLSYDDWEPYIICHAKENPLKFYSPA